MSNLCKLVYNATTGVAFVGLTTAYGLVKIPISTTGGLFKVAYCTVRRSNGGGLPGLLNVGANIIKDLASVPCTAVSGLASVVVDGMTTLCTFTASDYAALGLALVALAFGPQIISSINAESIKAVAHAMYNAVSIENGKAVLKLAGDAISSINVENAKTLAHTIYNAITMDNFVALAKIVGNVLANVMQAMVQNAKVLAGLAKDALTCVIQALFTMENGKVLAAGLSKGIDHLPFHPMLLAALGGLGACYVLISKAREETQENHVPRDAPAPAASQPRQERQENHVPRDAPAPAAGQTRRTFENDCPICFDANFDVNDEHVLPCGHRLHPECFGLMEPFYPLCPLCLQPF